MNITTKKHQRSTILPNVDLFCMDGSLTTFLFYRSAHPRSFFHPRKMFLLNTVNMGGNRSNLTALRYAEWARLIDQNKNVSKVNFDVQDIGNVSRDAQDPNNEDDDDTGKYNATRLVKVIPTYAYRNRRMTEKDLFKEMLTTSEKWEDFRGKEVGDREEDEIGCVHVEVLACHGLVSSADIMVHL